MFKSYQPLLFPNGNNRKIKTDQREFNLFISRKEKKIKSNQINNREVNMLFFINCIHRNNGMYELFAMEGALTSCFFFSLQPRNGINLRSSMLQT